MCFPVYFLKSWGIVEEGNSHKKEYLLLCYVFYLLLFFHVTTHLPKARTEYIVFWSKGTKVVFLDNILITITFYHINSYCSVTTGGEVAYVN